MCCCACFSNLVTVVVVCVFLVIDNMFFVLEFFAMYSRPVRCKFLIKSTKIFRGNYSLSRTHKPSSRSFYTLPYCVSDLQIWPVYILCIKAYPDIFMVFHAIPCCKHSQTGGRGMINDHRPDSAARGKQNATDLCYIRRRRHLYSGNEFAPCSFKARSLWPTATLCLTVHL